MTPSLTPSFSAVIVAAGEGLRARLPLPKQFAVWRGKPLVRHSAETLLAAGAKPLVVAIPSGAERVAAAALAELPVKFVLGGSTRQQSVRAALEALVAAGPERVLVHDAARAAIPSAVIARLLAALEDHSAAIPVLPIVDSVAVALGGLMTARADRDTLRRVQTPQAFRFAGILQAHRAWTSEPDAGDDAQVALAAGLEVALVEGDERLHKMTFAEDFATIVKHPRTGTGFDVHRLAKGEPLWLCGVRIPHDRGLVGHSDADVALHAVVDAVLGACGAGDIGVHFPPSEARWRGAASSQFVEHAVGLAAKAGYQIGNVDLTLICEAPRLGAYREAMRKRLAELLGTGIDAVNIKATTTERLGFTGRGEGIAAQAVATLVPMTRT